MNYQRIELEPHDQPLCRRPGKKPFYAYFDGKRDFLFVNLFARSPFTSDTVRPKFDLVQNVVVNPRIINHKAGRREVYVTLDYLWGFFRTLPGLKTISLDVGYMGHHPETFVGKTLEDDQHLHLIPLEAEFANKVSAQVAAMFWNNADDDDEDDIYIASPFFCPTGSVEQKIADPMCGFERVMKENPHKEKNVKLQRALMTILTLSVPKPSKKIYLFPRRPKSSRSWFRTTTVPEDSITIDESDDEILNERALENKENTVKPPYVIWGYQPSFIVGVDEEGNPEPRSGDGDGRL